MFFFQAEDGIRYLVRSRGLGDVYKRQGKRSGCASNTIAMTAADFVIFFENSSNFFSENLLSLIHI
mgnify:CR=1 FL=1